MNRLDKIRNMLADDPDDVFLNYALALELDKDGQHDESLQLFDQLTSRQPPYVPAFFMAAQMLNRLDRCGEAEQLLKRGVQAATAQGDDHAATEMTEFLEMIDGDQL